MGESLIKTYSGYNFFSPPLENESSDLAIIRVSSRSNAEYLATHACPDKKISITASFICAHAPDYVGVPTVRWQEEDWCALFAKMKQDGIDTVIFQAALWNELRECYYRSTFFKTGFRQWETVAPLVAAARHSGMHLFLGGYGSLSGWKEEMTDADITDEINRQCRCIGELLDRDPGFDGIYYSPEAMYQGHRDPQIESRLNRIYCEYLGHLRRIAPGKQILMSPATMYCPGTGDEFLDFWRAILNGVPEFILAPQDSIGTYCCQLVHGREMWLQWRRIADEFHFPLWANIELFEREQFSGPDIFAAASPHRVLCQLDNAATLVERCTCWEYTYFTTQARGAAALHDAIFSNAAKR